MSQLWKSELNPGLHPVVESLNRSIDQDSRLWSEEIQGSKAHVKMLQEARLISSENAQNLLKELEHIKKEIFSGDLKPEKNDEDVHSWIERELVRRLGPVGSNIHIARSRNEQTLLDTYLYLRSVLEEVLLKFDLSIESLKNCEKNANLTILPAYTHLRKAQPIYLKEYWEAHRIYWEESRGSFENLKKALYQECPMGSGAIHGTTLPTLPEVEAKELEFKQSPQNSLATLSSRKLVLDFMSHSTHWMLHVSRLMEDLILFSTGEFGFISMGSQVTTGSSMMPQKRNPDLCELIRGKSASVLGHYVSMMTLIKGLPMGYMKDLQEDKTHLFSVVDILLEVLSSLPVLLDSITLNLEKIKLACVDSSLLATDVMEFLVLQGSPLRQAHHQVAQWVKESEEHSMNFIEYVQSKIHQSFDVKSSCAKRYQQIKTAFKRSQGVVLFCFLTSSLLSLVGCESKKAPSFQEELVMGVSADYPPFEFRKEGQVVGFDRDLAQEIVKKLGYSLKIRDMDFSSLIPSLQSGQIDFAMSGITVTEERRKNIQFSSIYYSSVFSLLTRKEEKILNESELSRKKVGAQLGTVMEKLAKKMQQRVSDLKVVLLAKNCLLVEELKAKRIEAVIMEKAQAQIFAKTHDLTSFELPEWEQETVDGYAIAFPLEFKTKKQLQPLFNQAIEALKKEGVFDEIYQRWLGEKHGNK